MDEQNKPPLDWPQSMGLGDVWKAMASARNEEWSAICKDRNAIVGPLKARIGPGMDATTLNLLWHCNRLFIDGIGSMEFVARDLEREGDPRLRQSLEAWRRETESVKTLIEQALSSRQAPAPPLPATPPAIQPATDLDALENRRLAEFNAIYNEMLAAVKPIQAAIDASYQGGFVDRSPLFSSIYNHYQVFLNRIAQLAPAAQDLSDRGRPRLMQSIQAQKTDVEGACKKIQEIVADGVATNRKMAQIAQETNKAIVDSMLSINDGWKKTFNR